MKVVIAHNRYSSALPSGENTIVDAEIGQLREAGVEVLPFLRSSDDIATLPASRKALLPVSPVLAPHAQRELAELLRRERPDLLHLHNPYPLLSPWVVRTAHRHGVPVIHTVHNYRQVCVKATYFRDGRICQDCRGRAYPVPAVRHACYRGSRAQSLVMATALTAHRSTWHSVDRYIALTDAIADHLRDFGIPPERITVKPNGIQDPGPPAPPGEGFLFASRLDAEKGLDLLLDAWQRHPDGSLGPLRIVGDGPLRSRAERVAQSRDDVTYLGTTDRDGMRAVMRDSAVVIAASTWHDVLPTVVIEALASGRPVLGTRRGGIPYIIGEAGWIVDADAAELAAALPIARSGAGPLGTAARQRYEQTFSPERVTKRLLEIYGEVSGKVSR